MATPQEQEPTSKYAWLEQLLDELRDELISYAKSLGAGRESEDIVQTVYAETWQKRHTIDPTRYPRALLYTKVGRAVAKENRHRCSPTDDLTVLHPGPDGAAADVAVLPRHALQEASRTLDEDDRMAITLRYFLGQPIKQIANQLGLTESGVSWKLIRAKETLKKALKRSGWVGIPIAAGFSWLTAALKRASDAGSATAAKGTGAGTAATSSAVSGGGAAAGTTAAGASATTIGVSVAAGAGALAIVIGIVTGVLGGDAPEANADSPPAPATEVMRAPDAPTRSATANGSASSHGSADSSTPLDGALVLRAAEPGHSLNPASSDPGGSGDPPLVQRSLNVKPDGPNGPEESHSIRIPTPVGTAVAEGDYRRKGPVQDPLCRTVYPQACED